MPFEMTEETLNILADLMERIAEAQTATTFQQHARERESAMEIARDRLGLPSVEVR